MAQQSLGLIETIGLVAAIEAADAAAKSAGVVLVGYELSRGGGMATVKIEGDVGAVEAAIASASAAAARVGQVVSTRVIARPAAGIDGLVANIDTVGAARKKPSVSLQPEIRPQSASLSPSSPSSPADDDHSPSSGSVPKPRNRKHG